MTNTIVSMIMAHDALGGVAIDNHLPWKHNKEDMEWFVKQTKGKVVVMGRKTWESLPIKPLPGRINIVLTATPIPGVETFSTVEAILERCEDIPEIMVMGGPQVYKAFSEHVTRAYITRIGSINPSDISLAQESHPWEDWDMVYFDTLTSETTSFVVYQDLDNPGLDIYFTKGMVSEKE